MISCHRFRALLHPVMESEVEGNLALALGVHAASCTRCDSDLRAARRLAAVLGTASKLELDPPTDLAQRIMAVLPPQPGDPGKRRRRVTLAGSVIAAALAAALASILAGLGGLVGTLDPGLRLAGLVDALRSAAAVVSRFAALLQAIDWVPPLPRSLPSAPSPAGFIAGLTLVAIGLAAASAAAYLSTLRSAVHRDSRLT